MGQELPLQAIRTQIASGIDIIIQLGRIKDKSRKVLEITELKGIVNGEIELNPLYKYVNKKGKNGELEKVGQLISTEKMISAGIWDV